MVEDIQGFCEQLSRFLNEHSLRPVAVSHCDETRVVHRCGWLTNKRVEVHRKNRPNATFNRIKTVASFLTHVAASTTVFFSECVLNGKFNEGESAEISFAL